MVPPGDAHGSVQGELVTELKIQGQRRGLGLARSEVGIVLRRNPDRLVGADAAFITNRSLPLKHSPEGYLETIPELVVEVRSKNDSIAYLDGKIADYLAAGVEIVLVADPRTNTVSLHRSGRAVETFAAADELKLPEVLPDFRCVVADLFR